MRSQSATLPMRSLGASATLPLRPQCAYATPRHAMRLSVAFSMLVAVITSKSQNSIYNYKQITKELQLQMREKIEKMVKRV